MLEKKRPNKDSSSRIPQIHRHKGVSAGWEGCLLVARRGKTSKPGSKAHSPAMALVFLSQSGVLTDVEAFEAGEKQSTQMTL